jgi:hypothetical protein
MPGEKGLLCFVSQNPFQFRVASSLGDCLKVKSREDSDNVVTDQALKLGHGLAQAPGWPIWKNLGGYPSP